MFDDRTMGRRRWRGHRLVGFYTDKKGRRRPITRGYGRYPYSRPFRLTIPERVITSVEKTATKKVKKSTAKLVSVILSSLSIIFPQFSPIFEAGRLILNNRRFFVPFVKTLLSNKSSQEKLEAIERDLQRRIERKAISEFSKISSKTISKLMEEQVGFNAIAKKVNKSFGEADANIFQNFFENTLEKLIRETALKVLGNVI